ncbi:CbiX/SirB N-terminal domain-containing protein [Pandoraea sp.]|uniref:sirohydrochlorin chelatase n=1 Tax=Pandoraea sp. TaxID=1883445 RepID=UPI001211DE88|nr:CbiX/SirB N-terminal domain-containing protein [Pandoraea sp.]TAL54417.1 MAG: cobalamin biosynthesis protein CbiX [Pandoraea sp.]TAM17466.1 MAG: cobalamin biosynthesis protein CbiX [Pandoraea sp.]
MGGPTLTGGSQALILFGHGARDARWAEPFERLRQMLAAARPELHVALAFLELMSPSLPDAIAAAVSTGCREITVVPMFLGQGGHVRRDLPNLIDACRAAHPELALRCVTPVGEDSGVLAALAAYCLQQVPAG